MPLTMLREFLREEIKARQMGDWSLGNKGKTEGEKTKNDSLPKYSRGRSTLPSTGALIQNAKTVPSCCFCKESHFADECKKFAFVEARKAAIKGHCYRCLAKGHSYQTCSKARRCYHCQENTHHRSLCPKKFSKPQSSSLCNPRQLAKDSQLDPVASEFCPQEKVADTCINGSLVFMQMAVVRIPPSNLEARIFLDNGSSCSYITSSVMKALNLKPSGQVTISNARFEDCKRRTKTYPTVNFQIPTLDGSSLELLALVTENITCPIQRLPVDLEKFPILKQIQLADAPIDHVESVPIDILVGSDHYFDMVNSEQVKLGNGLVLLGSRLGYITAGRADSEVHDECSFVTTMLTHGQESSPLSTCDVERFWKLEDIGIKGDYSQKDDELAVQRFNDSVELVNGRYQVGWPWKDENPDLPNNYGLAYSRLRSLLRRITKDDAIFKAYDDTIRSQLASGIIEAAPNTPTNNQVHYIPHHCVVKPDRATTKLRIVYDASSKANKSLLSLNDCLLRGPVFLEDLCGLLMRFRTYPIAMIGDIENAFLQVGLQPSDRDVTRFLWLKDRQRPLTMENLLVVRFQRVPFGVISSPFLLAATVKHHLIQQGTKVAEHIASNIYVDNTVCGSDSMAAAIGFYWEAKRLFQKISMNIREWFTNCPELRAAIPEVDRGKGPITKVLGMTWDTEADTISCNNPKLIGMVVKSKRHLLQAASRVFDPCGLFSPITLRAKILVHGKHREAEELVLHPGLLNAAVGIRSWITSLGFLVEAKRSFRFDQFYKAITRHLLESRNNSFYEAFVKYAQEYEGQEVEFVQTSAKIELVWSCGTRKSVTSALRAQHGGLYGFNVYGEILTSVFEEWKTGLVFPFSLNGFLASVSIPDGRICHSVLLLADSEFGYVRHIDNGTVLSIGGAKYHTLADEILQNDICLADYQFVIIHCGVNMCRKNKPSQWKHSWESLEGFLFPILTTACKTRIIVNSPILNPKARYVSQHGEWLANKLQRYQAAIFCDWSSTESNPFIGPHGRINKKLYTRDKFHINHNGFRELWKKWSEHFPELRLITYEMSSQKYSRKPLMLRNKRLH